MSNDTGGLGVGVERANLEDNLNKAMNEGDGKVDSSQTRKSESIPHKPNVGWQRDIVPELLDPHIFLNLQTKKLGLKVPLGLAIADQKKGVDAGRSSRKGKKKVDEGSEGRKRESANRNG